MKGKVCVLIALAIALLSVSIACAYASYVLKQEHKDYIVLEEGYNDVTGRGYQVRLYPDGTIVRVEVLNPDKRQIVEPEQAVSAVTGVSGFACLGTVIYKKKKGVW